jgi:carbonic anhydrase/acetyltransferase-like protein (isoleucine patch superfamily)
VPLYELDGIAPSLPADGSAWIAPGARLIGRVTLAEGVSIWFNAVLRGDNEPITIGRDSNVQDGCVFHTDPGFPLAIGADVTVGHRAILHGCTIGDGCLIGMGATVMNGASIGASCLLAANALVTEGKEIPDRSLVVGQPARVVRTLDDETVQAIREASSRYRARQDQYRGLMRRLPES